MAEQTDEDAWADEEIRWLTEVLAAAVTASRRTRQSVEKQLGMSTGYMSKILSGAVDLRTRHILRICDAIGLAPKDFYLQAYEKRSNRTTSPILLQNLQALLGTGEPARSLSETELEATIRSVLGRMLGLTAEELPKPEPS